MVCFGKASYQTGWKEAGNGALAENRWSMNRILIFDASLLQGEHLATFIRCQIPFGTQDAEFLFHTPEEVFTEFIPRVARAAFFTLSSMYDVEAARTFAKTHKNVPLIVVSDSEEFGVLSWRFGTRYYLKRPYPKEELCAALTRCIR